MSGLQPGVDVAQAALRGGSPQTALQIVARVLTEAPGNEAALVVQGDALTALGQIPEARTSYNKALQSNPQSLGADVGLGRTYLADDPARAEGLFLEATHHEPRSTVALTDLGVARDLQGNHAGAQQAYRQALGIDPQDTAASVNLALSMAMSGSADQAVRLLRPLADAPGASTKVRHDLAAALTMAGDREEAARILSTDLSPEQVQQALAAYAAARSSGPPALTAASGAGNATIVLTPPVTPPSVSPPPVSMVPSHGRTEVQLAALVSESGAHAEWRRLQHAMPSVLGNRKPLFPTTTREGRTYWLIRLGGFADSEEAAAFCQRVRDAGGSCFPHSP